MPQSLAHIVLHIFAHNMFVELHIVSTLGPVLTFSVM